MTTTKQQNRFFTSQDAPAGALAGEQVAVLGYGHLGRPAALNMRDSGVQLIVGNIEDEYAIQARADGFQVSPVGEAVASSDIILILLPDEVIPEVFEAEIGVNLQPGSAFAVASGYTWPMAW